MKLKHQREPPLEINLTPLIDVVFLLLIFFMVSTTFQRDSELSIELPEASAKPQDKRKESVDVSIDAQGRFYVNGRALINAQIATVKRALQQAADGRTALPVVISADAKTPHQAVISLMDAARQAGLVRLTFTARLVEEGGN